MPRPSSWTATDLAMLGELAAEGLPVTEIAVRMRRTKGAIWTIMARRHLTLAGERDTVRERVLQLASEGWAPSRIAVTHGLEPIAIRRLLAVRGIRPASPVRPRPTGRIEIERVAP